MRLRTGHGPNDWTDNAPASAQLSGIRGALVVGAPGPNDRATHNAQARKSRAKIHEPRTRSTVGRPRLSPDVEMIGRGKGYATEEERLDARRQAWRESEKRKRETQQDFRSKLQAEIAACREVA